MKVALNMGMKTLILVSIVLLIGCAPPRDQSTPVNASNLSSQEQMSVCSDRKMCRVQCELYFTEKTGLEYEVDGKLSTKCQELGINCDVLNLYESQIVYTNAYTE